MNRATIIGRLGSDPELRYTDNGSAVAKFNIATSEKWKGKDGEKKEKTEWHRIVCWQKLAELCGEYLSKGDQCCVTGRIETRKWQGKDGADKYTTEIIAKDVEFLGSKKDKSEEPRQYTERRPMREPGEDDDLAF